VVLAIVASMALVTATAIAEKGNATAAEEAKMSANPKNPVATIVAFKIMTKEEAKGSYTQ